MSGNQNNNIIIDGSVCKCNYKFENPQCHSTIYLQYGNIGVFSSNVTNNNVYLFSAIYFFYAENDGIANYSTFENNTAHGYICLLHRFGNYRDEYCNVINNYQDSTDFGTFYIGTNTLTIKNCTIRKSNKKGATFSINDGGKCIIINCNTDSFTTTSDNRYSTTCITFTNSFNVLYHISTYKCEGNINENIKTEDKSIISPEKFVFSLSPIIFESYSD